MRPIYPSIQSLSNQIHRLDYKEESDTVTVRQYTRVSKYSTAEIPYEGLVWSSMASGFRKTEATFNFPVRRRLHFILGPVLLLTEAQSCPTLATVYPLADISVE